MKIATKKTLQTVMLVALCASAAGVTTYVVNKKTASKQEPTVVVEQNVNNPFAMKTARSVFSGQPVDFTEAAEKNSAWCSTYKINCKWKNTSGTGNARYF